MSKNTILTLLLSTLLVGAPVAVAQAPAWSADEVALARHCISEASGARTDDCRVIVWIDIQHARHRNVSPAAFIAQQYTRHTQSTSRPWLAGLNETMLEPAAWPESVSWDNVGRPGWEATLGVARRVLQGDVSHGCTGGAPQTWGGRTVDRTRLDRMLSNGWVQVQCGNTLNDFLRRAPQP